MGAEDNVREVVAPRRVRESRGARGRHRWLAREVTWLSWDSGRVPRTVKDQEHGHRAVDDQGQQYGALPSTHAGFSSMSTAPRVYTAWTLNTAIMAMSSCSR